MKTKNLTVSIIVAVLVVALWWTMLLKPTRAKVAKAKSDTTAQEAKLAPLQQQLSQAQRDAAHAAEFKAQLESLQLALPNSPALAAFIRNANGIASAAGVKWESVTHATPTPGVGGVESISVSLQVQGPYGHIIDYLSRLASLKRLLVVDNLSLAASSSSTSAVAGGAASQSTGPFSGGD
jgi:Tfp pilus assembly protein PilO